MSEPDLRALEILLVEDSDDDAELTVRALKKCRLANLVHRVRDGEEAMEFLFSTGRYVERGSAQPRVVLLDLKLPKLDGRDVLRAIRGDLRTASTPVVVLTSSAEDRDLAECYRLGANSYIVKPVEFAGFFQAIEQLGFYWAVLNRPAP
jgi:two-component system, response regulator